jgi:hypothetical protein
VDGLEPEQHFLKRFGQVIQALYIDANAVSPPPDGTTSIRSIEMPGGSRSHDTSVCQASPAA